MTDEEAEADDWVASPYLTENAPIDSTYDITVNLSTGVPIENLKSTTHKINISKDQDTAANVTLCRRPRFYSQL